MTHYTYHTSKRVIFLPNVLSSGSLIMSSKIVFSEVGVSLMCEPQVNISQIVCNQNIYHFSCMFSVVCVDMYYVVMCCAMLS